MRILISNENLDALLGLRTAGSTHDFRREGSRRRTATWRHSRSPATSAHRSATLQHSRLPATQLLTWKRLGLINCFMLAVSHTYTGGKARLYT